MNKEDYIKFYIQGSDHYLISKDVFDELFEEMENWREDTQKYKEVIDKAIDYVENGDLLYLANKCSIIYRDNVEVVSISDILNDLLTKLK